MVETLGNLVEILDERFGLHKKSILENTVELVIGNPRVYVFPMSTASGNIVEILASEVEDGRLLLISGAMNTGKTTLQKRIAQELLEAGVPIKPVGHSSELADLPVLDPANVFVIQEIRSDMEKDAWREAVSSGKGAIATICAPSVEGTASRMVLFGLPLPEDRLTIVHLEGSH